MPRNPANDITANGTTRTKVTNAIGPADAFRSTGVVSPAGVVQLVGNQSVDVSRVYGDGSQWTPVQGSTPGTLVPGQFFIETSGGVQWWTYVDSASVAHHVVPAGPVTTNGLTMSTDRLLGRTTAGTGAIEEITVGAGLTFAAGVLSSSVNSPGGSPTDVQFNTGGSFDGVATFTYTTGTFQLLLSGTAVSNVLKLARTSSSVGSVLLGVSGDRSGSNTLDNFTISNGANTSGLAVQLVDTGDINLVGTGFATNVNINVPVSVAAGLVTAPGLWLAGDPNTGLYSVGADQLGVTTGGVLRLTVSTTALTSTVPFLASAGLVTAPSISLAGDPNTGLYSVGADQLGVAAGGVLSLTVSTTALTSTVPFLASAGLVTAPSISLAGDPNTGIYSVGADDLGFATNGVLRLDLSTTLATLALPLSITGALTVISTSSSASTLCSATLAAGTVLGGFGSIFQADLAATIADTRFGFRPLGSTAIAGIRFALNSSSLSAIDACTFTAGGLYNVAKILALNLAGGDVTVGTDPGGSDLMRIGGALTVNSAVMIQSKTSFTNGAAGSTATLTNAPAAGNPTKWIPVNDNGTTRYIPSW